MSIERRAGAQRERIAVAAHVGRGAVAAVEPRQAAGRDDRRLGGDGDRRAGAEMQRDRAGHLAVAHDEIDDAEIAGLADAVLLRAMTVRSVFDTAGPVLRKST